VGAAPMSRGATGGAGVLMPLSPALRGNAGYSAPPGLVPRQLRFSSVRTLAASLSVSR